MQDLKKIRFVATNYSNLQGLRAVPLGLCLLAVCWWAARLHYPARPVDFAVPIACLAVTIALLYLIDRYYLRVYGRVQRTPQSRNLEVLLATVGAALALAAFWLDALVRLPVSLLGLVFAAGLLADYIRVTWLVKGRFLLYYPLAAIVMAVFSLLSVLGAPQWWLALGLRTQLIAIAVLIGIISILAGIWGHIYLARTLRPAREADVHAI